MKLLELGPFTQLQRMDAKRKSLEKYSDQWLGDKPRQKKMSKSKGNVVPESLIEQYSSDALRYWASKAKLGSDTIYDENIFKIGQRLATKVFNASKFVFLQIEDVEDKFLSLDNITEPVDRVWALKMNKLIEESTEAFETSAMRMFFLS